MQVSVASGATGGRVAVKGTVVRTAPPLVTVPFFGGLGGGGPQSETVSGDVDWHLDDADAQRAVIGTIKATPKGTGVGNLLVYHLTLEAARLGVTTIGTDLSALEEGTPEFYQGIGLEPSADRRGLAAEAVGGMPAGTAKERETKEAKRKDILYSARLDGAIATVRDRALARAGGKWRAGSG